MSSSRRSRRYCGSLRDGSRSKLTDDRTFARPRTFEFGDLRNEGDAIVFRAGVEHSYENLAELESVMYLVMTYTVDVERNS